MQGSLVLVDDVFTTGATLAAAAAALTAGRRGAGGGGDVRAGRGWWIFGVIA